MPRARLCVILPPVYPIGRDRTFEVLPAVTGILYGLAVECNDLSGSPSQASQEGNQVTAKIRTPSSGSGPLIFGLVVLLAAGLIFIVNPEIAGPTAVVLFVAAVAAVVLIIVGSVRLFKARS